MRIHSFFCSAARHQRQLVLVATLFILLLASQAGAAIDPFKLADIAEEKSIRWWFLALLSLVLTAGLWALRYLLAQAKEQQIIHAKQVDSLVIELSSSRQHHHDRLAGMQIEALGMVREVTAIVAATKGVIESNTRESEKVRMAIERWERNHGPQA